MNESVQPFILSVRHHAPTWTNLASVIDELVQRLEDAAPLAGPDATDGRRHRRLGEVGNVLGQLLLVLHVFESFCVALTVVCGVWRQKGL